VKSLCKWCLVGVITVTVLSVLIGTPGGKAQDSGWTTQVIAEGPDASKQRVITPDVAAVGDFVAVSYIQQGGSSPDKVCVAVLTTAAFVVIATNKADVDYEVNGTKGTVAAGQSAKVAVQPGQTVKVTAKGDTNVTLSFLDQKEKEISRVEKALKGGESLSEKVPADIVIRGVCFDEPERVISTSISAYKSQDGAKVRICVGWIRQSLEVYQRCADVDDLQWLSDPVLLSTAGTPAGQHDLQGDWSGNIDNAVAPDGTFYAVWSENYDTLKAAKSTDGINWTPCGDIPNQSGTDVRFPTIYVDAKGRVYAGATQTAAPDVQAWVSYDGCATWVGPTNVTSNSGFSDAPEFAVIGDKFYSANDDTTTNPNNVDINFSECNVTANAGLANCTGTRGIIKDAAWARMKTDGTNLHVVGNNQGATGYVDYCFSDDGGATWKGEAIPNSKPNNFGVRDPDFGIVISRNNIAVGGDGKVYIVWNTRGDGRSKIMLSVRSAPPAKAGAATCAP
jgi:hypothetical protein